MTHRLTVHLIIAALAVSAAISREDANSVYNSLSSKMKNIGSISLVFSIRENPGFRGTLKAKKGNKFIVGTPSNTIICNGKNVWNYNEAEKKVVISSYDDNSKSASVENFFFSFFKNYKPESLQNEKNTYILTLKPAPGNSDAQYKQVRLWAASGNLSIQKLEFDDGQRKQTWLLKQVKLNPDLPNKLFEFTPGKGVEVIDTR